MRKFYLLAGLCFFTVALFNCARESREDENGSEKRYLEAYNQAYYNGSLAPTASGLYYIEQIPGTGTIKPQDAQFAFIQYTEFTMNGNVVNTTDSTWSRQLGIYADSIYYGPKITGIGLGGTYAGLEEVLKNMTAGGEAKFIMPSWLSGIYNDQNRQRQSPVIIHVKMTEPVPDIEQWQTDTLEHFRDKHFPGLDSISYNFYCTVNATDTANVSDTLDILYVGYLLDGFVFDTNIADTAVKYRIYNRDRTYAPITIIKSSEAAFTDENLSEISFVEGFKKALSHMADGDKAHAFFSFQNGYGTEEQGSRIPAFSQLCFYIELKIRRYNSE